MAILKFWNFRQNLEFWKFQYFYINCWWYSLKIFLFYMEIPSELIGIRKILENDPFWSVLNWEILEHEPFWLSFELRNTGTRTSLITCEPGNTGKRTSLITCDPWRAAGSDGRPGRVTEKHGERIHFGNMYPEKLEYCIYHWILTLGYFYKKDARRKMTKIGPKNAPRSLIWDQLVPQN